MGAIPGGTLPPRPPGRSARDAGGPELSAEDYRIDYEELDVVDLVSQIRRRVRDAQVSQELPEVLEERIRARVRAAVDLDGERPFEVQRALHLGGTWNVTPQDLIESKRRGAGSLLSVFRRAARPGLKLFANLELPLYKQFKINLGIADALHELLRRTTEIEVRLDEMARHLEALEARRRPQDVDRDGGGNDDD